MIIRLAIADDHRLVREGLTQYLSTSPEIEIVIEAADGDELLEKLRSTTPDLLLLDMAMPGKSGVDLISHVRKIYPDLLILVLSMHDEVGMVLRAMRAGAAGYICKDCSPKVLLEAIRKVISTGRYLSPAMAEQLAYASTSPDPDNAELILSDRELEVFRLIVEGKSVSEIASQLFISEKTVSTHKSNLLNKLELKGVADLVRYAIEHKLFT